MGSLSLMQKVNETKISKDKIKLGLNIPNYESNSYAMV
jgi:hypothetical protein